MYTARIFLVACFMAMLTIPASDGQQAPVNGGSAANISPKVDYTKGFDWRDTVPVLYRATDLPPEEAVKLLFQESPDLRTYIAIELQANCTSQSTPGTQPQNPICNAKLGDPILEAAITKKIDEIVTTRTDSQGTMTSLDYTLSHQPYPFTWIVAMKSHTNPYASLTLDLPDGNGTTISQIESKYGAPDDTTVDADSFTLITYRADTANYKAKCVFRMDPNSGEARRVTITVERH